MKDAVLLLMHQGKSFTEEASEAAHALGLSLVAHSSRPEKSETLEKSQQYLADCLVSDQSQLTPRDLDQTVATFSERGYRIRAGLATFEGYRLLMADLNRALGARDSSPDRLRLCLNKYQLRQFLLQHGLSMVRCHYLNSNERLELEPTTWFVKPVRGASSFATFILKDLRDLDYLPKIQEQMRRDHRMKAIFMDQYDFLIEEYVEGPEFSFETIVLDDAHHICVQEKARVEHLERTTLEAMSISPPISVTHGIVLEGAEFISACLRHLGLNAGAFHIEAKYWVDKKRWEIIEINPRMGGSLINASVKTLIGKSILELWMESLLIKPAHEAEFHQRLDEMSQIRALRRGVLAKATVFLSKYGEKGRIVDSIRFTPEQRRPQILKLHVEPGTELEHSDRAICLMDALWEVNYADLPLEVERLDRHAAENFHVQYR